MIYIYIIGLSYIIPYNIYIYISLTNRVHQLRLDMGQVEAEGPEI